MQPTLPRTSSRRRAAGRGRKRRRHNAHRARLERAAIATEALSMLNVGEQLVSSYLRYIRGCEFTQTNLYTVETQGEIDVVAINLKDEHLYVCEVAIHLTTGLQYTKDKRPNNVQKLTDKFARDIEYAKRYFPDHKKTFMLWSPIVKAREKNAVYDQVGHLAQVGKATKGSHDVDIEFVVNDRFRACMTEMREFARKTTAELKCPVLRMMQIEEHLGRHLAIG
jgi:hypothetical protein